MTHTAGSERSLLPRPLDVLDSLVRLHRLDRSIERDEIADPFVFHFGLVARVDLLVYVLGSGVRRSKQVRVGGWAVLW